MTADRRPVFSAFADSRTGNRGAVSMLESAIDHLTSDEHPGIVNVFSVYPRADRRLLPTAHVRLYSGTPANLAFKLIPLCLLYRVFKCLRICIPRWMWGKEILALAETDLCLMIGGTTFSDAQKLKVLYNTACLLPAIILGKKAVMYSQTLGPFRSSFNRACARWCLSHMDVVIPRGRHSLDNVRALQLPGEVCYYPDAAFSLVIPEETEERIRTKYAHLLSGKKVVGISINSIVERKCKRLGIDHGSAWVQFIRYLQEKGYFILLIPHSMRKGARTRHNNDLLSVADICTQLPSKQEIHVVDEQYECKELRAVVGLADYYVASRFHSMISALCTGVPVLVFGWGYQKYGEVLEEFQLQQYCDDASQLSGEALINGFEEMVRNGDSIRAKIAEHLPRIKKASAMNHEIAWRLCIPGAEATSLSGACRGGG